MCTGVKVAMSVCLTLLFAAGAVAQQQNDPLTAAVKATQEAEELLKQQTLESARASIQKYQEAVKSWKAAGHHVGEAIAYVEIGRIYQTLGENEQSIQAFDNAIPAWKAVAPDVLDKHGRPLGQAGLAMTLSNIAKAYDDMGDRNQALEIYQQVLQYDRSVGNRYGEAVTLNNIGQIHSDLGETGTALDYLREKALPIWQSIKDQNGEGVTLNNLGLLYDRLGEELRALDYYKRALPLQAGNPAEEATTLNNIGAVYESLAADDNLLPSMTAKRKQDALDYYNRALKTLEGTLNFREQARTQGNICALYDSPRQKEQALTCNAQALAEWRKVGDRAGEAAQLVRLGNAQYASGLTSEALKALKQGRTLAQAVGDRKIEVNALSGLARIEFNRGDLTQARSDNESALKISQSLRSTVPSVGVRATYASTVHDLYEREIRILMRLHAAQPSRGYDVLALEASEQGRAQSLVEMLNESGANIRQGADPELLRQERALRKSLGSMTAQLSRSPAPQDAARDLRNLLDDYDNLQARIRTTSPRYASLIQPEPPSANTIQTRVLEQGTLLLEYALGEQQSYLWMVGPDAVSSFTLPGRLELELLEAKFAAKLNRTPPLGADEIHEAGLELSKILLGPVAGKLGDKRLVIVAEGFLSYLPFGLLSARSAGAQAEPRELALDHEIVYLPSASVLLALRGESAARTAPAKLLAILADPVFSRDDERVRGSEGKSGRRQQGGDPGGDGSQPVIGSGNSAGAAPATNPTGEELWRKLLDTWDDSTGVSGDTTLRRLRFTRREADWIAALVPGELRTEVTDFAASKATINSGLLSQFRMVHIATHGIVNGVHPELSGVVLSMVDEHGGAQDGFLQLHEIYNLNLAADLVVLSACGTGLGQNVKGEGLVGLTRGFMYAGAQRVVVSLWSVNDMATAELMRRFYRGMLTDKLPASKALQAAQVSMSKDPRWNAPYYWAGFLLYGDWQ